MRAVVPSIRPAALAVVLACAVACAGAPPPAPSGAPCVGPCNDQPSDDNAIAAAEQRYLDLLVQISPETATSLGLHQRDTELDDKSTAGFARTTEAEERMLAELRRRFATPHASKTMRTDLTILEDALAVDVRTRRTVRPLARKPDFYASPMEAIFVMTARDYAPIADRAAKALARIEKVPAVVAYGKVNLERPPRVWTQVGIEAAEGAGPFFDEEEPILAAALPQQKERIHAAIVAAKKAYADYADFLREVVLPRSDGDFAAGRDYFEFLLHTDYALTENADQVAALGEKVYLRTQEQMDEVAARIAHQPVRPGMWPEVLHEVKGHHPTAAELIPSYAREVARAREFLKAEDVVTFPAHETCDVVATPPFLRTTTIASYDVAPPFDPVDKGLFFVTPVDPKLTPEQQEEMLRENDHGDQVDTVVHETYPGHHLQLSIARTHASLIRKVTGPSIFAEGWALYAEELMNELGYYTDEERLMQLEWVLVRAARVKIDVGLHVRGMTFDQAVAVLEKDVHLEHQLAVSEVKRYTETPTQPLSYLIGREKIFQMRERMKKRDGASFSLRRFHDEILSHGTIAPGLLEHEIFDP